MPLPKIFRWFKTAAPLLLLQIEGTTLRFMVRSGQGIVQSGWLTIPAVEAAGRFFDVALVRQLLLARLGTLSAQVAVMLPASVVHTHFLSVPKGLDDDELAYQASMYITHELGLSLTEVYYDWAPAKAAKDQEQTLMLLVARQSDVTPYAQLFSDTTLRLRWVCAESLVWLRAFAYDSQVQYAVCKMEHDGLQVFWCEVGGSVFVTTKSFDAQQMKQLGFEYVGGGGSSGVVCLPTRFVVDEVERALTRTVHSTVPVHLHSVHVLGSAVNWEVALPDLQRRLGVPVRVTSLPHELLEKQSALSGLWQLSEQIAKELA
ncbi:MAG: hypothetical protein ACRCV6_06210 [Formosimonas sp.]